MTPIQRRKWAAVGARARKVGQGQGSAKRPPKRAVKRLCDRLRAALTA